VFGGVSNHYLKYLKLNVLLYKTKNKPTEPLVFINGSIASDVSIRYAKNAKA